MSWTVTLERDGVPVAVEAHTEGGQYAVGGTPEASLYVTYNYGEVFRMVLADPTPGEPDVLGRLLGGKTASDAIPLLERAVERCGTRQYRDYWAPTPGNAGHALNVLLGWALMHPDAVFRVEA